MCTDPSVSEVVLVDQVPAEGNSFEEFTLPSRSPSSLSISFWQPVENGDQESLFKNSPCIYHTKAHEKEKVREQFICEIENCVTLAWEV
jgi:hypothetical protein